jgi:hypothetical protein
VEVFDPAYGWPPYVVSARTAYKTPPATVPVLLKAYSLQLERVYGGVA